MTLKQFTDKISIGICCHGQFAVTIKYRNKNFMTVLGYPQFGNLDNPDYTIRLSNSTGTFPEMWKEKRQPTVDTFVMQKLNELEQEVKSLKEIIE